MTPSLLPRLKPDPVPEIHPVPEYLASGRLKARYEETKRGLDVPWMGVVAMTFAQYPRFYDCLWRALEPLVVTQAFQEACDALRRTAEQEVEAFHPPKITARLSELGYAETELQAIRQCNETFSAGNMPYVLMATIARLLLEGHEWTETVTVLPRRDRQPHPERPALM